LYQIASTDSVSLTMTSMVWHCAKRSHFYIRIYVSLIHWDCSGCFRRRSGTSPWEERGWWYI